VRIYSALGGRWEQSANYERSLLRTTALSTRALAEATGGHAAGAIVLTP
jgi:hypothetical protein